MLYAAAIMKNNRKKKKRPLYVLYYLLLIAIEIDWNQKVKGIIVILNITNYYNIMGKDRSDKRRYSKKRKFGAGKPFKKVDMDIDTEAVSSLINDDGVIHVQNAGPSRVITNNNFIPDVRISPTRKSNYVVYKKIVNKSREKMRNSLFSKLQNLIGKTRQQKINVGVTKSSSKCAAAGNKLIDSELLKKSLESAVICKHCRSRKSKMKLFQLPSARKGLAEHLILRCTCCGHENNFMSSRKSTLKEKKSANAYDINIRSTYASQGMGQVGLGKFCGLLEMPPPVAKEAYNNLMTKISFVAVQNAEKVMKEAADRLLLICIEEDPECSIELLPDVIGCVAVSVDGTWQKRGHCSKTGVVFVISIRTGEVLDYELKTMHCRECLSHQNDVTTSSAYIKWENGHKDNCDINHSGSSDKMETNGAIDISLRSMEKRKL